jgi:hypothetical protein
LQHKRFGITASQGLFIIAPLQVGVKPSGPDPSIKPDKPDKSNAGGSGEKKKELSAQAPADDFEISIEWAKSAKPTLPNPTGAASSVRLPEDEPSSIWSLQTQDKTLYHSISRWAQLANWQLMWEAERDFPIQAQISIEGSFTAAIQLVMNSLASTDFPLQAVMNDATVNDAVGKYILNFFEDLKVIPPDCAQVRLTTGSVPSAIASTTNCKFTTGAASGVKSPTNALQPTVTELKKLTMLDSSFEDRFMWTTLNTVNGPKASCTTDCLTGSNTEPTRFVNRIQLWCDGSMLTGPSTATCATTMQLKSLTFNSQPFAPTNLGSFFKLSRHEMLSTAINAMGGDGMMSFEAVLDAEGKGKLYGVGRQTSETNPIVYFNRSNSKDTANNTGITGIMAVKNAADVRCSAN